MNKLYPLLLFFVGMNQLSYGQCTNPPVLSISSTDVLCNGSNDGTATVNASQGTPPYTYLWNTVPVQPTATITGISAGTYEVTVTDSQGCTETAQVNVDEPTVIDINGFVIDPNCFGNADGEASVLVNGGTPPYNYSWSNGDNSANAINLAAGNYVVTATDANGCTVSLSLVISEPDQLVIEIVDIIPATCGSPNGSISVVAAGGTSPYTYEWSPGIVGSTPDASGLAPGFYQVTVTDNNGCTAELSIDLISSPDLAINTASVNPARCDDCNGSIDYQVSGGIPPYTFVHSNFSTTEDLTNLCPGTYGLTVTDATGCTVMLSTQVDSVPGGPDTINLDISGFGTICNGECTGLARVSAYCGSGNYTYTWSNGGTTPTINNLCGGTYTVTVNDDNGLSTVASYTVSEPPLITISGVVTNTSCLWEADGCIDIVVTGGTQGYNFIWSNNVRGSSICDIPAGSYTVTVSDVNGCTAEQGFIVGSDSDLGIPNFTSTPNCNGDGTATVTPQGGISPYTYSWSNGDTTQTITDLVAGLYLFTITDNSGCTFLGEIEIDETVQFEIQTTPSDCNDENGSATVVNIAGSNAPTFNWSNGGTGQTQNNLNTGGYSVTVIDANTGCRRHRNFEIEKDSSCFVTIFGFVYDDSSLPDCTIDGGSLPLRNSRVELSNGDVAFTNADGYYQFTVEPGLYTVTSIVNPISYEVLCADPILINAPNPRTTFPNNNFYYKNKGNFDLNLKVNKGRPRSGFERTVRICVMNYGSVPVSGTLRFEHDPIQEFRGSNFPVTSYDANTSTVLWDFTNLAPGPVLVYNVRMYTPASVPLGTQLQMTFHVDPISGDLNPSNNTIVDCPVVVRNSYDPNDKAVMPMGEGAIGRIDQDETDQLEYLIRFQNTGNDTAYTVVVQDVLDDNLDPSTIVPGASSHDYTLEIKDGNILEFRFDNIYLPDSTTDLEGSNGFVFFDVKLKDDLSPGTEITNNVDIFFDFNPPIRTNTVLNTIRGEDVTTIKDIFGCDEVEYNGQIYSSDVTIIDTIPRLLYDSIIITNIEVETSTLITLSIEYCEGENPIDPGIYTETYQGSNGCDSTVITEVSVIPLDRVTIDTMLDSGGVYDGQVYVRDTTLEKNLLGSDGCDSLVTVNVIVITTSITDPFGYNNVQVFPNPASSLFTISFDYALTNPVDITLFDLLGRTVVQKNTSDNKTQLNVADLPVGSYWLRIRQGNFKLIKKVVIIR